MEKLNVPTWYKHLETFKLSPVNLLTANRRQVNTEESLSSPIFSRRRRHISQSSQTTSTLERISPSNLSSIRRFGPLTTSTYSLCKSSIKSSSSTASSTSRKPIYLGWRSKDRLDIGPSYLTTPAQRLTVSVILFYVTLDRE